MNLPIPHLRPAVPADLDAILALERATDTAPHWPPATYAAILRTQSTTNHQRCLLVAESSAAPDEILGFAVAVIHTADNIAELESIAVAASARRAGIGLALCTAVLDWCRHHAATSIHLEVRASSAAAIGFYTKLGFVSTSGRPRYYSDPNDDALLMTLQLTQTRPANPPATRPVSRRNLLLAVFLIAILTQPLRATMLIVVYTPDGYWIGADSARSDGKIRSATVCKVHDTKFGLLLKAGPSQGVAANGDHYSTDREVEDLLAESTTAEEFKTKLKLRFEQDIDAELVHGSPDPNLTLQTLDSTPYNAPLPANFTLSRYRNLSLFVSSGKHRLGELLVVKPQSNPIDPHNPASKYHYAAVSTAPWIPIDEIQGVHIAGTATTFTYPPSVRMLSSQISYTRPDAWVRSHPGEALLEMLQLGHDKENDGIGPPYVLVHVVLKKGQKQETHWIEPGPCPSWTDDMPPDSTARDLKNP